jgi:hypothetical protein
LVLFFSHFLVLGQHVGAGVNEWLMIRNLDRDFFRWLPICRYEVHHGSGDATGAVRVGGHKRRYRGGGNICGPCGYFAAGALRIERRCQEFQPPGKDFPFFLRAVHLRAFAPYTAKGKFTCNLNDMRS